MHEPPAPKPDPLRVLDRFPGHAAAIRRLVLGSEPFRSVCEDYVLARDTLDRFRSRADAGERPEVTEYERLVAELEVELLALLDSEAKRHALDDPSGRTE